MLSLVLAAFISILFCTWVAWKRIEFCRIMSTIPGPKPWPIVGNVIQLKRDPHEFYKQVKGWADEYQADGLFCVWLAHKPVVAIFKPEHVEMLLSSQKNITKSPILYRYFHPWLGTGLLTSTGEKWKSRRRLLTPAFHFKILNDFVSIHEKQSATLVKLLQAEADKGEFNIAPYITLCVLDIICETSMGVDIKAQVGNNSEYTSAIFSMCDLIQERQKFPWFWPDVTYKMTSSGKRHQKDLNILHNFTSKVINDRIEQRKQNRQANKDSSDARVKYSSSNRRIRAFLDLLLEEYDQGNITKEGVKEEVDTFMFEGHDTTAASLQWAIHLIGHHPEIQSRLQMEVDSFFESVPVDGNRKPDQLKDLTFLECVLKEALRMFPSVPLLGRELTEKCKLDRYDIPEGCTILVAPMALHRNPEVWDDPDKFNPHRFLSEAKNERHPFAYVPFSAGPRNCIGQKFAMMEEKIVLASIIRHFNIESTQLTDDLKITPEIILKSMDGIIVKLQTRHF